MVPRFGLGTSEDLRDALLRLCRDESLRYLEGLSEGGAEGERQQGGLPGVMATLREEVMVHEKLFPPGRVVHIRPDGKLTPKFYHTLIKGAWPNMYVTCSRYRGGG